MSRENIINLVEELIHHCWPDQLPVRRFPRLTYAEAMHRYGSDKPDTRFGLEIEHGDDQIFIRAPFVLRDVQDILKENATIQFDGKDLFSMKKTANIDDCLTEMGKFRLRLADLLEKDHQLTLRGKRQWNFLWVVDFPLFTRSVDNEDQFESTHHPFTAPIDEHRKWLTSPERWSQITGQHYDLVLNGFEVAGGSIRIHDASVQRYVLNDILHLPIEHLEHLLQALEYGAPPHGGIALGLDRLLALALETKHIRDVIAFPKTSQGKDLMAIAPSLVEQEELDYYFLKIQRKQ